MPRNKTLKNIEEARKVITVEDAYQDKSLLQNQAEHDFEAHQERINAAFPFVDFEGAKAVVVENVPSVMVGSIYYQCDGKYLAVGRFGWFGPRQVGLPIPLSMGDTARRRLLAEYLREALNQDGVIGLIVLLVAGLFLRHPVVSSTFNCLLSGSGDCFAAESKGEG